MNAVVDTNILIDFLNGSKKARAELDRFERESISIVTWMEVLVGVGGEEHAVPSSGGLTWCLLMPGSPSA